MRWTTIRQSFPSWGRCPHAFSYDGPRHERLNTRFIQSLLEARGSHIAYSSHDILSTYSSERRPIALRLIELDKQTWEIYSQSLSSASEEYQSFRDGFFRFLSGTSVTYEPKALVTRFSPEEQPYHSKVSNGNTAIQSVDDIAKSITFGRTWPSHKVVYQCESTVVHLATALSTTGK